MSREECEVVRRENEELKEVLSAVQLDLEARQRELTQRDSQLRDTNTQLVNAKARITVSECLVSRCVSVLSIPVCVRHRVWRRRVPR